MKHAAFKRILAFALLVALLSPALPAAHMKEAAGSGILLDFDPEGGYTGDYVLLFNGLYGSGRSLTAKFGPHDLQRELPRLGLDEFGRKQYICPYKQNMAYGKPDPFVPEMPSQKDPADSYQVGDVRSFLIMEYNHPLGERMAFQVLHVGQYCRIWSPLNPDFLPLNMIDESYAALYAAEFDAQYPRLTRLIGQPVGLPGDGKIEVLFYDIEDPFCGGRFAPCNLYEEVQREGERIKSDNLPVIQIDTYGAIGITRVDEQGNEMRNMRWAFRLMVHEMTHLLSYTYLMNRPDYSGFLNMENAAEIMETQLCKSNTWFEEILSSAAEALTYPDETLEDNLYSTYAVFGDFQSLKDALKDKDHVKVAAINSTLMGSSTLIYSEYLYYPMLFLLSVFALDRGGEEIFNKVLARYREEMGEHYTQPARILAQELGFPDESAFLQDFFLALILRDAEFDNGRYRFFPEGLSPQMDRAAQIFRPLLVPQIANLNALQLEESGFAIVRPKSGTLVPNEKNDEGITYVGITLKPPAY